MPWLSRDNLKKTPTPLQENNDNSHSNHEETRKRLSSVETNGDLDRPSRERTPSKNGIHFVFIIHSEKLGNYNYTCIIPHFMKYLSYIITELHFAHALYNCFVFMINSVPSLCCQYFLSYNIKTDSFCKFDLFLTNFFSANTCKLCCISFFVWRF